MKRTPRIATRPNRCNLIVDDPLSITRPPFSRFLGSTLGNCGGLGRRDGTIKTEVRVRPLRRRACARDDMRAHGRITEGVAAVDQPALLGLREAMGCNPPGSSVHGISQVRILEWVAISFSRGASQPRDF